MKFISTVYRSKGSDKRGVQQIQGKWNTLSIFWTAYLIFAGIGFVSLLLWRIKQGMSTGTAVCASILLSMALLFMYFPVQSVLMRRRIKKLNNADSISSRFGVEAERLTTFAEEQGIKPRYNINGEDFYDIKDFGDAAVLLRASVAPAAEPETLLRPAAGTVTDAENLLRPSNG